MKNLIQRTITGLLFILVVIAAIVVSEFSFAAVFLIISTLALIEFYHLMKTHLDVQLNLWLTSIAGILLFVAMFLFASAQFDYRIFALYFIFLCVVFIVELYRKKENPIMNWAIFSLGQLYIALPFSLLSAIAYVKGDYNSVLLLAFFVCIWVYDTGAYVVGVAFGKHRLFERISPKKSWEGFFGGLLFSLVSAYVFSVVDTTLSLYQWIGFSVIIVIFGTFGDLSESLLKRSIGVKDSGKLLPGHGGVLDRFDSILFSTIAITVYLQLIVFN